MTAPRVLGVDLSLTSTGLAWLDDDGTPVSALHRTRPSTCLEQRLDTIAARVLRAAAERNVDLVVIEDFVTRSPAASLLGLVHGVVRHALWRQNMLSTFHVDVVLVPPASLKLYATGKGNADKGAVLAAAIRRFGYDGSDHNEADALIMAAMACDAHGAPLCDMPAVNRKALAKVTWPRMKGEAA